MPCCAFALFVIGQIAAFGLAFARALGLAGSHDAAPALNPATAWQLHGAATPALPFRRRPRLTASLMLIALLELGAVAAGIAWVQGADAAPGVATDTTWCGSPHSFTELAALDHRGRAGGTARSDED